MFKNGCTHSNNGKGLDAKMIELTIEGIKRTRSHADYRLINGDKVVDEKIKIPNNYVAN